MSWFRRRWLAQSILSVLSAFLVGGFAASCGGGGGGGGGAPPSPVPRANSAPVILQAYADPSSLTLSAPGTFGIRVRAADPDVDPLSFQWSQVAGPSAGIRSPQADYSIVDVQPPAAGQTVSLTFRVRVSDPTHSVDSSDLSVTVMGAGGSSSAITVADQQLTYDELGRLTEVSLNGGSARIRYQYDDDGNMVRREVVR